MTSLQITVKQETLETNVDTQEVVQFPDIGGERFILKKSPEHYSNDEQDWKLYRQQMGSPNQHHFDEEDEGAISTTPSPHKNENDRFSDPIKLDFNSWKEKVGSLIQSENQVMMHSDEELREAITKAMFLDTASENLMNKRKQQLELIDKCRVEEGVSAKKLYDENLEALQKQFGAQFKSFATDLAVTLEKASRPLNAPDVSKPPPLMPMPPFHIPPPSLPSLLAISAPGLASTSSSTSSVTNDLAKKLIIPTRRAPVQLMSQHLLPPPIAPMSDPSRSEKFRIKHEEAHEHETLNDGSTRGFLSTSWRTPYRHPVPVPPPKKYPFTPHIPLPPLPRANPVVDRRRFNALDRRSTSPHSSRRSLSGFVGVNVRGLFVGKRPRVSRFANSPNTSDDFK